MRIPRRDIGVGGGADNAAVAMVVVQVVWESRGSGKSSMQAKYSYWASSVGFSIVQWDENGQFSSELARLCRRLVLSTPCTTSHIA
jgi:hypothetical protein